MAATELDDMVYISRLACLGSEEGVYNVLNQQAPLDEVSSIKSVIEVNRAPEVVKRLRTIAQQKRYVSKKNLLYSLAHVISGLGVNGDDHKTDGVSTEAYELVQDLCDHPYDLFTFVHFNKQADLQQKAKFGRGMRDLITSWYNKKSPVDLAEETTQCKSGYGFTHRDIIKQTHIKADESSSKARNLTLTYLLYGKAALEKFPLKDDEADQADEDFKKVHALLHNIEKLKDTEPTEAEFIRSVIETHKLLEKQIPSHFLKLREAYEGLLGHMSFTDLIKTVIKMSSLKLLEPNCPCADVVISRLSDVENYKDISLSPISFFIAMRKYDRNHLNKWVRNNDLSRSLHFAYDQSLNTVMSTGQRYLLAVHIDDKIVKNCVAGASSTLSPIMACAILAQIFGRVEPGTQFVYFKDNQTVDLKLTKESKTVELLEQMIEPTKDETNANFDMANPLKWATQNKKEFDCILIVATKKRVLTHQDFKDHIARYRTECGLPNAKIAIVGLSDLTSFPDREDVNFLDVSGFGEEVPFLLQQFFKGIPTTD